VAGAPGARVYDIETGDGTPAQGADWARREHDDGRRPGLYANQSTWGALDAALGSVGLGRVGSVDGWLALYDSIPAVPAGFVAKQYAQNVPGLGGHGIDLNVTNGLWPLVSSPPSPKEPPVGLAHPAVAIAHTPTGRGYWIFATDGGVFTEGDAVFHGSLGGKVLAAPIVGGAATPSGDGYWLVGSDGGIFAFGGAGFFGSLGGVHLDKPIVGMAPSADGNGYWLIGSDGGIFAFGDAPFEGTPV
jgi:hypothetical protein